MPLKWSCPLAVNSEIIFSFLPHPFESFFNLSTKNFATNNSYVGFILQGANGFLIVYDVTNGSSFTRAEEMLKELDMCGAEPAPKILIGNKVCPFLHFHNEICFKKILKILLRILQLGILLNFNEG